MRTNHKIDSSSLFGRVVLVFFWGGWAAIIVIYLNRLFAFSATDSALLVVLVNMLLILIKEWLFRTFNK